MLCYAACFSFQDIFRQQPQHLALHLRRHLPGSRGHLTSPAVLVGQGLLGVGACEVCNLFDCGQIARFDLQSRICGIACFESLVLERLICFESICLAPACRIARSALRTGSFCVLRSGRPKVRNGGVARGGVHTGQHALVG